MKIRLTENELKTIASNVIKKAIIDVLNEGKTIKKNTKDGYLKASRSANRNIDREFKGDGFKQNTKVHKSPKDYSRKGRNKDSWKNEIDENSENEVSYKTSVSAKNKAVADAYRHLRTNGPYENEPYDRKIRQINKFDIYPEEIFKKTIGTKVQVIIEDKIGPTGLSFYTGTITNVKEIKKYIFIFSTILNDNYDKERNNLSIDITVDFSKLIYKDIDELVIEGVTNNGFKADIKFSNKKVRLAIANLINKTGNDEFLKTFR